MENLAMLKLGASNAYKIMSNILGSTYYEKSQILEPCSSIIRIALLHFKKTGTKISICNNKIYYQGPNYLQPVLRWTNDDKRNDIHQIHNPIKKFIQWYDPKKDDRYKHLVEHAIMGLETFRETYLQMNSVQSGLVIHAIDHYINMMKASYDPDEKYFEEPPIDEYPFDDDELTEHIDQKQKQQEATDDKKKEATHESTNHDEYIKADYQEIKDVWTDEEISLVHGMLLVAHDNKINGKNYRDTIKSIECILDGKDEQTRKIVQRMMTSL